MTEAEERELVLLRKLEAAWVELGHWRELGVQVLREEPYGSRRIGDRVAKPILCWRERITQLLVRQPAAS